MEDLLHGHLEAARNRWLRALLERLLVGLCVGDHPDGQRLQLVSDSDLDGPHRWNAIQLYSVQNCGHNCDQVRHRSKFLPVHFDRLQ